MKIETSPKSTTQDTQNDVEDKILTEQKKSALDGVGNEITLMLMDQQLSDEDKLLASELSQTVSLAKESEIERATETESVLLNAQVAEETEPEEQQLQDNTLQTQQLGEQMGVKVDATQPSFAVQPVPQAPAPAHRRSGFVRFLKAAMTFLTGSFVVRGIVKWRHKTKSAATLEAARQKAERLATQVRERAPEGEQQGQQFPRQEATQEAQALDFRTDNTKVPIIWEQAQGYGIQDPVVEAHVLQAKPGDRTEMGMAHSFIVLRYSKVDYRTDKERRYRLAFGLNRRTAIDMSVEFGYNVTIPGALVNDGDMPSNTARSYNATPEQVNTILNEAPKEADKGYNFIHHNCTTYVVNLLKAAGLADPGIQEEYLDLESSEMKLPAAKTKGGFQIGKTRDTLMSRMDRDDFNYGREGKKLVGYEDIERFESSFNFEENEFVGYGPGMLGEQIRTMNAGDINRTTSFYTIDSILGNDTTAEQNRLVDLYLGRGEADKASRLKYEVFGEITRLATKLHLMDAPLLSADNQEAKDKNAKTMMGRNAFLSNIDDFENSKRSVEAAAKALFDTEEAKNDPMLNSHTYNIMGRIATVESEFYKKHNEYVVTKFGVGNDDYDLKAVLEPSGVLSNQLEKNPIFLKCFDKVFGSQSYQQYKQRKEELLARAMTSEEQRELGFLFKKFGAVTDYYNAEQYKFQKFSKSTLFSQDQVNDAFGKPAQEGQNAEKTQSLYSLVVLSKLFPGAKSTIVTETDGYNLKTNGKGHKYISSKDCCNISCTIAKIAEDGIDNDSIGLFDSIVMAVIVNSGVNPSADLVTGIMLDNIFNKFFNTITEGTRVPVDFLNGLANADKFPSPVKKMAEFAPVNVARNELVAKIQAAVARVMSSMQRKTA